jgi:hypothetical protein
MLLAVQCGSKSICFPLQEFATGLIRPASERRYLAKQSAEQVAHQVPAQAKPKPSVHTASAAAVAAAAGAAAGAAGPPPPSARAPEPAEARSPPPAVARLSVDTDLSADVASKLQHRTPQDFVFKNVLGEGAYSTVREEALCVCVCVCVCARVCVHACVCVCVIVAAAAVVGPSLGARALSFQVLLGIEKETSRKFAGGCMRARVYSLSVATLAVSAEPFLCTWIICLWCGARAHTSSQDPGEGPHQEGEEDQICYDRERRACTCLRVSVSL